MPRFRRFLLRLRIRSLRVDIMTAFITILFAVSVVLITHTFRKHSQVILEFSGRLMYEVGEVAMLHVIDFLNDAEKATELGASFIQSAENFSIDNEALVASLFTAMSFNSFIQFYGMGTVDGTLLGVAHILPGTKFQMKDEVLPDSYVHAARLITNKDGKSKERWIYYDKQWHRLAEEEIAKSAYDPRDRLWYGAAVQAGEAVWSNIYFFNTTRTYGITISVPSYDSRGNLLGVFLSDVSLAQISRFTEEQVSAHSVEMIINEEGTIIAAPKGIVNLASLKEGELSTIHSIEDKRFAQAFAYHTKTQDKDFVFTQGGERYLATFTPFPDKFHKDWAVVVIAPLEDFLGKVVEIQRNNIYLSVLIFLFAALLVLYLSRRISKPIVKLAGEIDEIKQFNLDRKISVRSYIKEIRQITQAVISMKNAIQSFSYFVPKQIVEKLVVKGRNVKLGGETKRLTIFFSDITDFTHLCEGMSSEALMLHISNYLDELSKIIIEQSGTIDKYIGDSIMAFWGAPDDDPNDAEHAVATALICQKKLEGLNEQWQKEGKPPLVTRIGVHRGDVIVGNIGTSERMNYTLMGDNVNLAARLEGANKYYGTKVIISEEVKRELPESIITRPLDIVAVKGKEVETKIYEVLEDAELARRFTESYDLFMSKNYDAAKKGFEALANERYKNDRPTQIYLERCQNPDQWSGVHKLDTK